MEIIGKFNFAFYLILCYFMNAFLNVIWNGAEGSSIDWVPVMPDVVHSVLFLSHFIPMGVLYDEFYYTHFFDEKIEV